MDSPADPATPSFSDTQEWITAYLTVHSLSVPSRRYSFLLWLSVAFIFVLFAAIRWSGFGRGFLCAIWSKWSLRRRTWRKKHTLALARNTDQPHRQLISLPSNAQLLSLLILTTVSLTLAFVGPDYLNPNLKVWQIQARSQLYDTTTFESYMPQYTISKSLWSSSARTGQIAFALLPLCVLFALKAPPFAIFAIPFVVQLYFDKLAYLHRWAGRLIWFLTLIHVVLWSVKLATDVNSSTGRIAYVYAWSYTPFIFGWIAFALLSLIILLSLRPIRRRFYEHFYILHVLLVPCMLLIAGLHHPTVAWWCWAALIIWMGERLWRATWWIYANGVLRRVAVPSDFRNSPRNTWEMDRVHHHSIESEHPHNLENGRSPSPLDSYYHHDKEPISPHHHASKSPLPVLSYSPEQSLFISHSQHPYIPPPGYVHAELVSGRTVRLRLITPGFLPWSPGQHFLLNIPSVSRFTSHPFTCASVCDEAAPTDAGRTMLFLVRGKGGWTQRLWNRVSRLTAERSRGDIPSAFPSDRLPVRGVLLRAYVDGPFGSAKRVRWGNYSTAVIVTGGSGVSFGLSLLQYMSMCLAGRDARHLGGQPGSSGWNGEVLQRVRFIWLVREYSHIQWCACVIRHCMTLVPPSALQVDIYVTNFKPIPFAHALTTSTRSRFEGESVDELEPPHPNFAHDSAHSRHGSRDSIDSHESYESDVDLTYYLGDNEDDEPPADDLHMAHEKHILDLTNFDGDVDVASPGELHLSRKLKKEGKLRRLKSRKRFSALERINQTARPSHLSEVHLVSDPHTMPPQGSRVPQSKKVISPSTDRLLPYSPHSERPLSSSSSTDMYPPSHLSDSPLHPHSPPSPSPNALQPVSLVPAQGGSTRPLTYPPKRNSIDGRSVLSMAPLSVESHAPTSLDHSPAEMEMDEEERRDVNIVSEHARLGKPRLDKVIADEVEASKGAIVVACCGPTSLNAVVRKIVALQINPGRIRKGDMRGSIALVSEEFEY